MTGGTPPDYARDLWAIASACSAVRDKLPDDAEIEYSHTLRSSARPEPIEFERKPFRMTVGAVCRRCNTGWMSEIESAAGLVVSGMIQGRGRELHAGGQEALAKWAALKVMMFDQMNPAPMVPASHYAELFERRAVPGHTYVWTAKLEIERDGRRHPGYFEARGLALGDPELVDEDEPPEAYVATFSIGYLVLKVFGNRGREDRALVHRTPVRRCIRLIWPTAGESFTWPPGPLLTPHGLQVLSRGAIS